MAVRETPYWRPQAEKVLGFGGGKLMIEFGYYENAPAVFIEPAPEPGKVGDLVIEEHKNPPGMLRPGAVALTFPTVEQAKFVADVLTSRVQPVKVEA